MFQKYSLRYEGDLVKGARKLKEIYQNNFEQTGLSYNNDLVSIGEIDDVAIIVTKNPYVANLTMIGLANLIKKTEKELVLNKLKLKKLK